MNEWVAQVTNPSESKGVRVMSNAAVVYRFGALAPTAGAEVLREQIRLAHRYRRALIATAAERQQRLDKLERDSSAEIARLLLRKEQLEASIAKALAKAKRQRAKERRRGAQPEARAALAGFKSELKQVREEIKKLRAQRRAETQSATEERDDRIEKRVKLTGHTDPPTRGRVRREVVLEMIADESFPVYWRARQRIDHEAGEARRAARAASGLYAGTYTAVENAVDASIRDSAKRGKPPHAGWVDSIKIGTQCQDGETRARVEIDPLPPAPPGEGRNQRRKRSRTKARVRIASDGGAPVWCELPIILHRPIPEGARILWAYIVQRRQGERVRYELQLTVEVERARVAVQRAEAVAVDIGWRVLERGIRAGYWVGTDGAVGEILVPSSIANSLTFAASLRSIADHHFETARAIVVSMRAELPEDLREPTEHLHQWRSRAKLVRVVREMTGDMREWYSAWRAVRLAAKLDLLPQRGEVSDLEWLYCWAKKDRHLYQWECDARAKVLRRRDEIFRVDAARLAARYQTLVLEGGKTRSGLMDLRKFAVKAEATEAETMGDDAARASRVKTAPGEARNALVRAFRGDVDPASPEWTTAMCHGCGGLCEWDQARHLRHRCEHCGAEWDQDENAARNMLRIWRESRGDAMVSDTARNAGNVLGSGLRDSLRLVG
jgi:hypothetical protein